MYADLGSERSSQRPSRQIVSSINIRENLLLTIFYQYFSVKPTLKKVSKYENKFAKLQKKAAEFNFRNQLKVVKKKEFTLEEEDKEVRTRFFGLKFYSHLSVLLNIGHLSDRQISLITTCWPTVSKQSGPNLSIFSA